MTKLNPLLTPSYISPEYRHDNRVRITEVINQDSAEKIYQTLLNDISYDQAFFNEGQFFSVSHEQWVSLSHEQRHGVVKSIYENASTGKGFMYGRHKFDSQTNYEPLKEFFTFLNSKETIAWIREVSGHEDITHASAQATRYIPGQFLTRHNDINDTERRRVAYVFSFTKNWHSDWGGLLQFHQQDGTPRDAWAPSFNTLSLFDVEHIHSVSYVAPFASHPRLSITGWFLA